MLSLLPVLLSTIGPILSKLIPDAQKAQEIQAQITTELITQQGKIYDDMAQVMAADAKSESWLTRNLRPMAGAWGLLMISVVVISAPLGYAPAIVKALQAVPQELWNLVMVTIGGYILARGVEKSVKAFTGNN